MFQWSKIVNNIIIRNNLDSKISDSIANSFVRVDWVPLFFGCS